MASAGRYAVTSFKRSLAIRPNAILRTLAPKSTPTTARPLPYPASRVASVLGSLESMLPLHSTIAIARLKSNIAIDSTCWSWLSQAVHKSSPDSEIVIRFRTMRPSDMDDGGDSVVSD